eukprot:325147_1
MIMIPNGADKDNDATNNRMKQCHHLVNGYTRQVQRELLPKLISQHIAEFAFGSDFNISNHGVKDVNPLHVADSGIDYEAIDALSSPINDAQYAYEMWYQQQLNQLYDILMQHEQ